MRRTLALGALMIGLSACGTDSEEAVRGTAAQAPTVDASSVPDPGPELRSDLDPGELGVVDFTGEALARPRVLRPNKDSVLRRTEWSGWGGRTATGRGTLEVLDCQPNCAFGQTRDVRAILELSGPRTCGEARYYGEAALRYEDPESGETREPAVFLRTPC